jgi:hypothetical protein
MQTIYANSHETTSKTRSRTLDLLGTWVRGWRFTADDERSCDEAFCSAQDEIEHLCLAIGRRNADYSRGLPPLVHPTPDPVTGLQFSSRAETARFESDRLGLRRHQHVALYLKVQELIACNEDIRHLDGKRFASAVDRGDQVTYTYAFDGLDDGGPCRLLRFRVDGFDWIKLIGLPIRLPLLDDDRHSQSPEE